MFSVCSSVRRSLVQLELSIIKVGRNILSRNLKLIDATSLWLPRKNSVRAVVSASKFPIFTL
jgi:hypothetical protein